MGIVNVTPDSFSDGGKFASVDAAVAHGVQLANEGADILDIGGESTRPGALAVAPDVEAARVVPVIAALRAQLPDAALSIDTRHASTARMALDAGADLINDVSGLGDPEMGAVVQEANVPVVLMHMQGTPATMQAEPRYDDVVGEVKAALLQLATRATDARIPRELVWLDPGLGFGKRTGHGVEDNCTLLSRLPEFHALGHPLVVGASRKRFIGNLSGREVPDRLVGSVVAAAAAAWAGAAVLRVHDVAATRDAISVASALDPTTWTTYWGTS